MSGFKVFVALHVADYASRHLLHFSNLAQKAGRNTAALNQQLKLMGGLAAAMIGGMALTEIKRLGEVSVDAARKVEQLKFEMRGLGMTSKDINAAQIVAGRLTQSNLTLTMAAGMRNFKDSYAIFGNQGEAASIQPFMAKFNTAMQGIYGDRGEEYSYDAMRAAELQMGKHFNAAALQGHLNTFTKMAYMTGGRVDPREIHTMMRALKYHRNSISDAGLASLSMLMLEMGGSQAGTGLQAIDRGLIGKTTLNGISRQKLEKWAQAGLIYDLARNNRGNITDYKVLNENQYMADPIGWMHSTFAPHVAQAFKVDPTNPASIPTIASMFSSQTAAGAVISASLQRNAIERRQGMMANAFGVEAAAANVASNPNMAFRAFNAQMENLHAALGITIVPLLVEVVKGLNPIIASITQFIREHPRITQAVAIMAVAGAAIVTLAGGILAAISVGTAGIIAAVSALLVAGGALIVANILTTAQVVQQNWPKIVAAFQSGMMGLWIVINQFLAQLPGIGAAFAQNAQALRFMKYNSNASAAEALRYGELGKQWAKDHKSGGSTNNISFQINESKTPRATAYAIQDLFSNLLTPKSGITQGAYS